MRGQEADFNVPLKYGTLSEGTHMPALTELTVCIDIYLTNSVREWAAMSYHIVGSGVDQELGIGSINDQLKVWLSGKPAEKYLRLSVNVWHTICFTWSNSTKALTVYLNGSEITTSNIIASRVTPGGSLVLGQYQQSHSNASQIEFKKSWAFLGKLYYFRVWDHVKGSLELSKLDCSDGNVISWRTEHLNFTSNTLGNDSTLRCASPSAPSTSSPASPTGLFTSNTTADSTTSSPTPSKTTTSSSRPVTSDDTTSIVLPVSSVSPTALRMTTSSNRPVTSVTVSSVSTSPVTAVPLVHFFSTNMTLIVSGGPTTGDIWNLTNNWLKKIFSTNITLLDMNLLKIKPRQSGIIIKTIAIQRKIPSVLRYTCLFRLEAISTENQSQIKKEIKERLISEYYTESEVTLAAVPDSIHVLQFEPGLCRTEETVTETGRYTWPPTQPITTIGVKCIKNPKSEARRDCELNVVNKAEWSKPNVEQCEVVQALPDNIPGLESITVNTENAENVAKHIFLLTNNASNLSPKDLEIVISMVSEIVQIARIYPTLGEDVIGIINNLLNKTINLEKFSTRILDIMETVGNKLQFTGSQINIVTGTVSLALVNVNFIQFWGIAFGVMTYINGFIKEIYMNETSQGETAAFIELPSSLQGGSPMEIAQNSRIQFHFYGETSLFQDSSLDGQILNSYVVSSSVAGTNIINLHDPVKVTLRHINRKESDQSVSCVFWDSQQHNGVGGWNSSGCQVISSSSSYTTCYCNHLTHFGILMDISRRPIDAVNMQILTLITYVGCGVSSFFLGIILLTYLAFEKLRRDYPSKILMNLCTSLFMLNIVFLTDSWIASFNSPGLCISVAASLHYFLLTSFTWMGIEAVHMYFALVKVFNIYVRHYILKFCLIGWGLPLIIVVTLLSVDVDFYGYGMKMKSANPPDMLRRGARTTAKGHAPEVGRRKWWSSPTQRWRRSTSPARDIACRWPMASVSLPKRPVRLWIKRAWRAIHQRTWRSLRVHRHIRANHPPAQRHAPRCWLRDDTAFYVAVVAYFGLIFLVNLAMFIVVLSQIQAMKTKRHSNSGQDGFLHHLKSCTSLTILLGLTWGFAFFAWGPAQVTFMYLFSIFNTLQGFFLFMFHCLMKENVRTQWRVHLCCGRFKLNEYSDWSRTGTDARLKDLRSGSIAASNKSNSTTTSSNGSRKIFITPPKYGNGHIYSNNDDSRWSFDFCTDERTSNRDIKLHHKLAHCVLPHPQSPDAMYLKLNYTDPQSFHTGQGQTTLYHNKL
ncbi:adhesion G-protein coupled receptor G6-like [Heptranchias perlo]|uniref:adhesion G-protein coupled receptor G6-like n=1 Tax=Heptranchias perlo TaxID=212740 RepID=UPI003559F7E4